MKTLIKLLFFLLVISCSKDKTKDITSTEYYSKAKNLATKNSLSKVATIELKTSKMDSSINSSFVGNLWVNNNKLYFSDSHFNYVFNLDSNGNLINTHLGKGGGPTEIEDLDDIVPNKDGTYTVLSSYDTSIYNFDRSWNRISKVNIDFNLKRSYTEVLKNPEPSLPESYELETGYEDILRYWDRDYVAMAVSASHPSFNGYYDSDLFYNNSRIITLINKKTGMIEEFLGRRPPIYLKRQNIPSFNHFKFEVDKEKVYLSFFPDSNIYLIDKKSKLAFGKFGEPGREMKTSYRLTDNYEQALENEAVDLEIYGYYKHLKIIPEDNLIFRSYTKGKDTTTDGLQIYKNYNLIGDLDVPKGFKMVGKINDDYIATISKETSDEDVLIYKVKFIYED